MTTATNAILARAVSVTRAFGDGPEATRVLHGVSLELHAGELTLVMGPSGSGKTTLVSILAGLLRPTSGEVELCGTRISDAKPAAIARVRRSNLGFIFQTCNLFPALSARDNVAEILAMRGTPIREARAQAENTLREVGLGRRLDHLPGQMSGGERQRVAIARALAGRPKLLIGDEPTAALDGSTAGAIIHLIRAHITPTTGALLVTHDRRLESYADRLVEIEDGRVKKNVLLRPSSGGPSEAWS